LSNKVIVIGSYISPYVRKVLAVLELKEIPYVVDPVIPFYGNDEFSKLNPARRIPVLLDGPVTVVDSTVIIEYLNEKYPNPNILPDSIEQRSHARWLEEYADSVMGEVFIWRYFNQSVIDRFVWGNKPDESIMQKALEVDLPQVFDYLESLLPGSSTLFDRLSIADIAVASFFRNLFFASISNIKGVLARNPLAPSRSLTRRWHPVVIDHLEITLVSLSS